jgi:hypothetical protein
MAIQISAQGSREAVIRHIDGFTVDEKTASPEEIAQLPALKAFLKAEVENLDKDFNGVNLQAQGTAHKGLRNFNANVIPMKLHL